MNDSGVYVIGYTNGSFRGQVNAGSFDVFVRKYDTAGDDLWTQQFGSDTRDWPVGWQ